jgi:hypothetical protein
VILAIVWCSSAKLAGYWVTVTVLILFLPSKTILAFVTKTVLEDVPETEFQLATGVKSSSAIVNGIAGVG